MTIMIVQRRAKLSPPRERKNNTAVKISRGQSALLTLAVVPLIPNGMPRGMPPKQQQQ